jgi:hypothetical protein
MTMHKQFYSAFISFHLKNRQIECRNHWNSENHAENYLFTKNFPPLFIRSAKVGVSLKISAGIFEQSMGTRDRVGIWLSYRPARLHSLSNLVPWN